VTVSAGRDLTTGERVRLTQTFDRKADAVAWRNEQVRRLQEGASARAGRLTVGGWLDEWLPQKKGKVEPATWAWYEQRVRLHIKGVKLDEDTGVTFGSLLLARLTPREVERLHAALTREGVSPSEQHKVATTLRAALADAVQQGLIASNPATRVKKPKVERREMHPLDVEQAQALLVAAREDRLATLFDVALDAGMRPGELFGLHWPDVDLMAGELSVNWSVEELSGRLRLKRPKTKAGRRRILLAGRTVRSLAQHRQRMQAEDRDVSDGLVFCDTTGSFLRQSNFRRNSFVPALTRAGLAGRGVKPYDLRHTSATLLLLAGVNVKVVSQRLGHESIEITLRHYAHVLPGMQEKARDAVEGLFGDCHTEVTQEAREAGEERTQAKAG
jgi:integrase